MQFDYTQQPGKSWQHKTADPKTALVSIITPFFNAGKYFEQTFNSVMNQTFPWFEWIIVNDGSTESGDIEILNKYAAMDQRIYVVDQENGGLSCARNTGIRHAKTDIVIPLDADDIIAPQYVEYVYFGLYYNKDAAWCYTDSTGFGALEYLWNHPWDAEKLKTFNFLIATAAIRKKDLNDIGGYKVEKQAYFEDWRFWLEMLAKHKKPVHLKGYLFWYRRQDKGMLTSIRKDPEQEAFAANIISTAAKAADGQVEAVEYPLKKTEHPFYEAQMPDFDKNYYIPSRHGKIRILLVIPWMVMGGADKFNLEFIAGLNKDKFEIGIITTMRSENEWHQKFEKYTDEIFHLPDFLDPAYHLEYISYYLKTRMVDILMVSNSYSCYYMLPWIRKNFPDLYIIDYVHMEEWYWKAGGYARISGKMGAFLDKTFVCNSATRQVMTECFHRHEDSVKTIYIGVNQHEFNRKTVKQGQLYEKWNIPVNKDIILFPCRIHPQKRPFMVLEIAEKVHEKNEAALFVIAGDGNQLCMLKQEIVRRKLDDVIICLGDVDDIRECYCDAKLTLICSLKEGLSLTAYESCAMGVPVISSDVGGQRDLIDSTVGKLIPLRQKEENDFDVRTFVQEEVQDFADAILALLSDHQLYEACSRNCRKKIEETFSVEQMSKNMECEILTLVSAKGLQEKHKATAGQLSDLCEVAEEFYTLHLFAEEQEQKFENMTVERNRLLAKVQQMENDLERIKTMRSWKIISLYQNFVLNTRLGRGIRKAAGNLYHLAHKKG